jgi:hypothetical protein
MHLHPALSGAEAQGKCVRATVRYAPAYSTKLRYERCDDGDTTCAAGWVVDASAGSAAAQWEKSHRLPADPIPTETINDPIFVDVNLREQGSRDQVILWTGIAGTALMYAAVLLSRQRYRAHLKRQ